jgi:hypothetical protein
MAAPPTLHPTDETLRAYSLGQLDDILAEAVNTHLESCPGCRSRAAGMSSDSFLLRLRDAVGGDGTGSFLPQVSISFEPGRASVLTSLAESLGGLPRVLLRDTDPGEEPSPLVKPGSSEMPGTEDRSGRYQLLGEIARGGMGAILRGRDGDLGRDLAVKVLLEAHKDKPELIRRFVEEAQIGGQLQHPGVVPIYDIGTFADRRPFFTMKLVKGQTLAYLLQGRKDPADGLPRYLSIFEQVCQTMAYAHARGVIHRDLKPSNIMVGGFGEVQIMDWGLAKVLPRGGLLTRDKPRHRPGSASSRRSGAARTPMPRRSAACWARPPTWLLSRRGARSPKSTSGPTSSGWGRSCAKSSRVSRRSQAGPTVRSCARQGAVSWQSRSPGSTGAGRSRN